MKISALVQDPRNANKGTQRGRDVVSQSLKDLGAGRSVLIDKNGVLIAGNKTAVAALAAGIQDDSSHTSTGSSGGSFTGAHPLNLKSLDVIRLSGTGSSVITI